MAKDSSQLTLIPIYNSKGDAEAFLAYPNIFNRNGDWVGWVTPQRQVYSVLGVYVGELTNDPRILRKRSEADRPTLKPPPIPKKVYPPATIRLAPLMSELMHSIIDVLLEEPERLHPVDSGELREDLD